MEQQSPSSHRQQIHRPQPRAGRFQHRLTLGKARRFLITG